jgi:hypothetical protein
VSETSGEGEDLNSGIGGDNIIASGDRDDLNEAGEGADIFTCGDGDDTVLGFNEAEGDIATPDCENV